jgi:hypothetical protein
MIQAHIVLNYRIEGVVMKSTEKKLILISLVLAIMAAGAVFTYLHSLKTPRSIVKTVTILVAAETIPPRTLIDKKMKKRFKYQKAQCLMNILKLLMKS